MDLRRIVKRVPSVLYAVVALGCLFFSACMAYVAQHLTANYGNVPVSGEEHAALFNVFVYGSCSFLCGLSHTASAIRAWNF